MGQEVFNLYSVTYKEGTVISNAVTFKCVLQVCVNVGVSVLEMVKQFYLQIKDLRGLLECDVGWGGGMVKTSVNCGSSTDN